MIRRRTFVTLLGGATAWPIAARAQQPAVPVVGWLSGRSPEVEPLLAAAFRKGLAETSRDATSRSNRIGLTGRPTVCLHWRRIWFGARWQSSWLPAWESTR